MKSSFHPAASRTVREQSNRLLSPLLRIALLVGVGLHLAGFLIFRIASGPLPQEDPPEPFVQFVSPSPEVDREGLYLSAALLDSAPLFVPTRWNTARDRERVPRLSEPIAFADFEPEIDLVAELRPEGLPDQRAGRIQAPEDLLDLDRFNVLQEFGRRALEVIPLENSKPVALVEPLNPAFPSVAPETGDAETRTMTASLSGDPPRFTDEPAEFRLRVSGDGRLIGEVRLMSSSGNDAFDRAGRAWLEQAQTLEELSIGLLRVRLFP